MSLKAKNHINTIHDVWAITHHGIRQWFGMLIFVHEMTSTPQPNHLTSLPLLLPCMNWLWNHRLIISTSRQNMLPLLPLHLHDHPSLRFRTPTESSLPLTMLMLLQEPQDMPPTLPPHVHPHPSLCFCTPTAYHPYFPAGPSRYASDATTPCPPSPILMILHPPLTMLMLPQRPQDMPPMLPPHVHPHPHSLPYLCSWRTLKICLQHCHPMSALTHAYALAPRRLPSLRSHRTLKICLQHCHPISALTHVYTSAPSPYLPCHLPSLHSRIRLIGYSGLLAYNAITEVY
ncbi:hypothetical protein O181_119535 [Austropuccinia psidii MF-1]|uniref:Uncharacterized protein n=1 Tax=Austropuccinia psidii MF-1 TaxID=1389203 RepID=A0A9Q3KIF8_9BASI|nr:hypothetical protein [Austropuccinia psidii MF-1]